MTKVSADADTAAAGAKSAEDELERLSRALPLWLAETFYFSALYAPVAAVAFSPGPLVVESYDARIPWDGPSAEVAANVALAVATGIAGLSVEDSTHDPAQPLYELDVAVERLVDHEPESTSRVEPLDDAVERHRFGKHDFRNGNLRLRMG